MSDSVLILGGGIAGLRAALDVAHAGARAIVIETKAAIGGRLASTLEDGSPALSLPHPSRMPSMEAAAKHPNIEILTLADLVALKGEPGEFTATIRQRARFVTSVCDQCNACRQACPVVRPNEFDAGLTFRKAIFSPLRNSFPPAYVIDIASCLNEPPNYLPCQRCAEVCHVNAIHFDLPLEETITRYAGAVIVAAGFDLADLAGVEPYGYGSHPDIVTAMELERLFATSGATGGFVQKPSNEQDPQNVLIILCDNSPFSWTYSARHALRLIDQAIDDVTILYAERPAAVIDPATLFKDAASGKVRLAQGRLDRVQPGANNRVQVQYQEAAANGPVTLDYDLVVLAAAVKPPADLAGSAEALGIKLGPNGFVRTVEKGGVRVATSRPGVYAAGCVTGPKNIQESIAESNAAVEHALRHLGQRFQPTVEAPSAAVAAVGPQVAAQPASTAAPAADLQERVDYVVQLLIAMAERGVPPR